MLQTYLYKWRKGIALGAVTLLAISVEAQTLKLPKQLFGTVNQQRMQAWADSVYNSLNAEERLAQLIMPIVYPSSSSSRISQEALRVEQYKWGGILYQKGFLAEQAKMNEVLQAKSQTPMLIALDGEWGLYMRLKDAPRYPRNLGLGLNEEDKALYSYGREVARQCRLMGIHINFAPTVDVNINPNNPVIGSRSFGHDPKQVAKMSVAYALGLEDGGVLSVAKHFPGHGDTSEDSHKTLPLVRANRQRLERVELAPFKAYFAEGLGGVMTAHLRIPALEPNNSPSSLSRRITTDLLQGEMKFGGLIFTDGLEMQGVRVHNGDIGISALKAGNDILLGPMNPEAQLRSLSTALAKGELNAEEIKHKVMKVLYYKYRLIISQPSQVVPASEVKQRIWTKQAEQEMRSLWQKSLYYLERSPKVSEGLQRGAYKRIAVVSYGKNPIGSSPRIQSSRSGVQLDYIAWEGLETKAKQYDLIVVNVFGSQVPNAVLERIAKERPVGVAYYSTPFKVSRSPWHKSMGFVLLTMEAAREAQEAVLALIAGESNIAPPATREENKATSVDESEDPTANMSRPPREELRVDIKGLRQINSKKLANYIDRIVAEGLSRGAFPGCQVYVMQAGRELLNKAYGSLEGTPSRSVTTSTLYDVASVSKALATTPAIMLLVADGKLKLNATVSTYLPELRGTFAGNITLRNLLLHQSGLAPGLPFIKNLFENTQDAEGLPYFSRTRNERYSLRLSQNYFVSPEYKEQMMRMIGEASPRSVGRYVYSDLNFILLGWIAERVSGQSLQDLLSRRLWQTLGAKLYYNPLEQGISTENIAPAQRFDEIRGEKVRATVDDESAACLGGIAGNAGIFSSAQELAKVANLILNKGKYGNKSLIAEAVVQQFLTTRGVGGVRTLGFIRPQWGQRANQAAESASPLAVGHYGFTGTAVWIDPVEQLVFVFLSNRTYKSRRNSLISTERYRPRLHQALYDAME